jgi:hypothetical protein
VLVAELQLPLASVIAGSSVAGVSAVGNHRLPHKGCQHENAEHLEKQILLHVFFSLNLCVQQITNTKIFSEAVVC